MLGVVLEHAWLHPMGYKGIHWDTKDTTSTDGITRTLGMVSVVGYNTTARLRARPPQIP